MLGPSLRIKKNESTPPGERSGSVVECLNRDRGDAGSGLIGTLRCVLEQDTLNLA